jgi:isopenicillin-N N-acyltransferase like protein
LTLRTHRSTEVQPGDRGRALGLAQHEAVSTTLAVYGRLLREAAGAADLAAAGRAVGETLAARWPDLLDEAEGIAAGARVPVEMLLAIQARTELLGGAECSLVAWLDEGCVVAQNWDWHPEVVPLLWTVEQPDGRWFTTLTEAGMLGKIGLSSAGLCFGLNFLRCSLDGGVSGVPVHVLLRVLLDRTDGLEEAVRLLVRSPVSASSCVTVASDDGLIAAEVSPGGCRLLPPSDGRILHTNHFLAGPAAGEDLEAAEEPSTFERLHELSRSGSLCSHVGPVCRHASPEEPWADRRATLASVVMEPGVPRLRIADGPPCEAPLVEVPLP